MRKMCPICHIPMKSKRDQDFDVRLWYCDECRTVFMDNEVEE